MSDIWEEELAEARESEFVKARGRKVSAVSGMEIGSERAVIVFEGGSSLTLFHDPDCCESVEIADVTGDPEDLVGRHLVLCECVQSTDEARARAAIARAGCFYEDSHTWTFYKLGSDGGYVTLRWLGWSNGYYSERVAVKFTEVAL